jgi:hypothetical protein
MNNNNNNISVNNNNNNNNNVMQTYLTQLGSKSTSSII